MNAHNLGFLSSWHMLTRDKGWLKPVLVLTLVGWIPVLGQIALYGYGLEWARLTAWGIDAAPKQRGVDYGKLLSSGGRAFLVSLTLGLVATAVLQIVFPGTLYLFFGGLAGGGLMGSAVMSSFGVAASLASIAVSALLGSFVLAASLRATIYDSFSAGWRLDRLFQMILKDFGGFLKVFAVTLIGGAIAGLYALIVTFVSVALAAGGILSVATFKGISGHYAHGWGQLVEQILHIGAGPLLLFVLLMLLLAFIGGVIATAMNLVSMNAMGQWFCRFDVHRWGVSGDPLPEGVPHREGGHQVVGADAVPAAPVSQDPGSIGGEGVDDEGPVEGETR